MTPAEELLSIKRRLVEMAEAQKVCSISRMLTNAAQSVGFVADCLAYQERQEAQALQSGDAGSPGSLGAEHQGVDDTGPVVDL